MRQFSSILFIKKGKRSERERKNTSPSTWLCARMHPLKCTVAPPSFSSTWFASISAGAWCDTLSPSTHRVNFSLQIKSGWQNDHHRAFCKATATHLVSLMSLFVLPSFFFLMTSSLLGHWLRNTFARPLDYDVTLRIHHLENKCEECIMPSAKHSTGNLYLDIIAKNMHFSPATINHMKLYMFWNKSSKGFTYGVYFKEFFSKVHFPVSHTWTGNVLFSLIIYVSFLPVLVLLLWNYIAAQQDSIVKTKNTNYILQLIVCTDFTLNVCTKLKWFYQHHHIVHHQ